MLWLAGCGGAAPPAVTAASLCQSSSAGSFDSLHAFVKTLRHSNAYTPLSLAQTNAIRAASRSLLAGDLAHARTSAAEAGYELVAFVAAGACQLMLRPTDAAPAGQGTLIVAASWQRDLVIEAPHVPNDLHTDDEAALVFVATGARALVVAGASRCAVTDPSSCHHNVECNLAGIAVESDPSHSERSAVHAMHLGLALDGGTPVTLQLHTNVKPMLNGDAQISNGTRYPIAGTAADALFAALSPSAFDVRSCNQAGAPPAVGAFCGEVNAQSLVSNGATDACNGRASHDGPPERHRFIQLEQNADRLLSFETWSATVADAVAAAVPAR